MTAATGTRTWVLRFPAPAEWLSANKRYKRRPDVAIRAWRQATALHARSAQLPRDLQQISVYATLHFTNDRRRDAHNYMAVVKCCVDGLVDYGLIPDDRREHLLWTAITEGDKVPAGPLKALGEIELRIVAEAS
ncbi:hypothetical protein [Paractinoplanes toevensis]|uniref:RusA-like resolvase n=1 Tax=Paractinoplanes toevensis TaxID=571911 RepID=A0A919T5P7_9ACTN|nr:hypothetical protein [Actinoplanes toevensis]GIM88842.1 hypothetical protein Ato02nite_006350 [Actinoplanes toevensis]